MNKKDRIASALSILIREIDIPEFKNHQPQNLRNITLSENLDSLGMVNLIVNIEDVLKKEFQKDIPLLGNTQHLSADPFKTVGSLIDYIDQLI